LNINRGSTRVVLARKISQPQHHNEGERLS
jgi:hypothetical protein